MSSDPDILEYVKMIAAAKIIDAAASKDFAGVDKALAANPDAIHYQDSNTGVTALHIAAADGHLSLTEYLLSKPGVDVTIRDWSGRDALDLAIGIGHAKIIDAISKKLYPKSFGLSGPAPT